MCSNSIVRMRRREWRTARSARTSYARAARCCLACTVFATWVRAARRTPSADMWWRTLRQTSDCTARTSFTLSSPSADLWLLEQHWTIHRLIDIRHRGGEKLAEFFWLIMPYCVIHLHTKSFCIMHLRTKICQTILIRETGSYFARSSAHRCPCTRACRNNVHLRNQLTVVYKTILYM